MFSMVTNCKFKKEKQTYKEILQKTRITYLGEVILIQQTRQTHLTHLTHLTQLTQLTQF